MEMQNWNEKFASQQERLKERGKEENKAFTKAGCGGAGGILVSNENKGGRSLVGQEGKTESMRLGKV